MKSSSLKPSIDLGEDDSQFSNNDSNDEKSDSNDRQDEQTDDKSDKKEETTVKKIRVVARKPQPKLDPLRLSGQRGLKCLLADLEKLKPKGEGHEFQDLDKMINKYEYWAHRLFPKMKFVDFIEKLEKLGEKREVKGLLNRIRLNEDETTEQNEDILLENQQMTEEVMSVMRQHEENSDDELFSNMQSNIQNTNEEEDEDQILCSLLNI